MKQVPLSALPLDLATRVALSSEPGVDGCIITSALGRPLCTVFGPACDSLTLREALEENPGATLAWVRGASAKGGGRTAAALALLDVAPALTPYQAAQEIGVNVAAVYRALKRRTQRGSCSCCGQLLPAS